MIVFFSQGAYLSAPIVNLEKKTMNVNLEANPAFLRMTDQVGHLAPVMV